MWRAAASGLKSLHHRALRTLGSKLSKSQLSISNGVRQWTAPTVSFSKHNEIEHQKTVHLGFFNSIQPDYYYLFLIGTEYFPKKILLSKPG